MSEQSATLEGRAAVPADEADPSDTSGRELIEAALRRGVAALDESEAKGLLSAYGISVTPGAVAATVEEGLDIARDVGFPVAMKGSSRQILHKSDAGLVLGDIRGEVGLRNAWDLLQERGAGRLDGILVEKMIPAGREFVIGMSRDEQFGPLVMFGVGGVLTEALKDVVFGVAPLDAREAARMLDAIRAKELLGPFRGAPAVDRDALARVITTIGRMALENPEIQEVDINPILLDGGTPVAVDALVTLGPPADALPPRLPVSLENVRYIFDPKSVALVGASNDPTKWGGLILASIISGGYGGKIFPVNPKGGEIFGLPAYSSIDDVPEAPELVLIALPAKLVPDVVDRCGKKGAKAVVVISGGFDEASEEGALMAQEAARIASEHGLAMVGPNSLGAMCSWNKFYGTGAAILQPIVGPASFLSQSGSMGMQLMQACETHQAGLGKYVGVGNEALVDAADLIEYFRTDPRTGVVLAYVEGLVDGRRFLETCRDTSAAKPVVLLRGGASEFGRKAAASHTGAMAASQRVFEAVVRQSGLMYTNDPDEFLDLAYCLSYLPLPRGKRIAIVTFGGGWGVLSADEVYRNGLQLAELAPNVIDELNALLPPFWSHANPIDLVGMFTAKGEPEGAVHAVTPSDEVDAVVVLGVLGIVSQPLKTMAVVERLHNEYGIDTSSIDPPDVDEYRQREEDFIRKVAEHMEDYEKPIINVSFIPMEKSVFDVGRKYSPVVLSSPLRAVRVLAQMARYREYLDSLA